MNTELRGSSVNVCNWTNDAPMLYCCSLSWWNGAMGGQSVGVVETADSFIFVFRGSQDEKDFITDAKSQVSCQVSYAAGLNGDLQSTECVPCSKIF